MSWRTIAFFLVAAVYVVAIVRTRWYVPPPTPNPPGSFAFAALGDAPYNPIELRRFQLVLRDMEAHDLRWVLHIGDIFDRPCSDDHYRTALARSTACVILSSTRQATTSGRTAGIRAPLGTARASG